MSQLIDNGDIFSRQYNQMSLWRCEFACSQGVLTVNFQGKWLAGRRVANLSYRCYQFLNLLLRHRVIEEDIGVPGNRAGVAWNPCLRIGPVEIGQFDGLRLLFRLQNPFGAEL